MKYAIIYKRPFLRSKALVVDAESFDVIRAADIDPEKEFFDPERVFVEWVVDFENQKVIRAAMKVTGELIEVPDGDFGEQTPAEYFENQTGTGDVDPDAAPEPDPEPDCNDPQFSPNVDR